MKEQHFTGDVGQVAAGNAVSHTHGPSQRNVINIHNGASTVPSAPITELQRRAIAAKVFEVSNASDLDTIDIYRIILAEFGAEKIRELPKSEYRAAMELLAQLEKEAGAGPSTETRETLTVIEAHPQPVIAPVNSESYQDCPHCVDATARVDHAIRKMKTARTLAGVMTSALLVVLVGGAVLTYTGTPKAKSLVPTPPVCQFGGAAYSIGSVVAAQGSKARECKPDAKGAGAHWEVSAQPSVKR
ncbi:hypothetical protein PAN31117_04091 [Pandoraea anapnoica]|uniref:Uncharacterized protein n=1 Tax=Pandoraea anapnoica TaxID=2508301 RepID=A0A5E5AEP7_9BURK|nr:hypothetical protein [Pandoraea anapnoica]VVE71547.1 hypothetical protein PAN31117_04091 [Pandoraea anapnoica]